MGGNGGINMLEIKWDAQLREVADWVDDMYIFAGGRWFISHLDCMEFAMKNIPEGQFQWFIDIVSYLQFFIGEMVSTEESQRD